MKLCACTSKKTRETIQTKVEQETYGCPSFPQVDKAIAFGSRKPAATASSNQIWNCIIVVNFVLSIGPNEC